jgi:hypothetical protein
MRTSSEGIHGTVERQVISQSEGGTEERAMSPMVKILLRRSLLTLSAIFVWAKALAGGSDETDKKTAGGQEQKPNREP